MCPSRIGDLRLSFEASMYSFACFKSLNCLSETLYPFLSLRIATPLYIRSLRLADFLSTAIARSPGVFAWFNWPHFLGPSGSRVFPTVTSLLLASLPLLLKSPRLESQCCPESLSPAESQCCPGVSVSGGVSVSAGFPGVTVDTKVLRHHQSVPSSQRLLECS